MGNKRKKGKNRFIFRERRDEREKGREREFTGLRGKF
jgi:hypothetical protein